MWFGISPDFKDQPARLAYRGPRVPKVWLEPRVRLDQLVRKEPRDPLALTAQPDQRAPLVPRAPLERLVLLDLLERKVFGASRALPVQPVRQAQLVPRVPLERLELTERLARPARSAPRALKACLELLVCKALPDRPALRDPLELQVPPGLKVQQVRWVPSRLI
jgi:hypothetical protein